MSTMTSKSLRFLDYNNDDEARVVDEWLKNERHRSIRRDNDDEVQCLSSPVNKKAKVMQPDLNNEYICYLDEETKTLEDTHPQTDDGDDYWIRAHNPRRTGSYSKQQSDALEAEFERTKAKYTADQITMKTCLDLAVRFGVLTGKWIIFWSSSAGNPAPTWQKIRSAVFDNQLGISAKIHKRAEGNGLFVICIYCRDFRDVQDVHRVRKALDEVIDYKKSLYFKPCALTHMGINANNPYGIRTTLYSCGGEGDCSTLFVNAEKCNNQRDCPRCFPHCRNA